MKKGQKKKSSKNCTTSIINKGEPSRSVLSNRKCIPEASERLSGALQHKLPHSEDSKESYDDLTHGLGPLGGMPEVDLSDDVVIINEDVTKTEVGQPVNPDEKSQLKVNGDEDFELQAMFYLPTWRSASPPLSAELNPGREESLKVILANVEALLSQSPPALIEDLESDVAAPSPLCPLRPFPVSFTLDVDDDDMIPSDPENNLMMSDIEESSVGQEEREIPQSHAHVEQSASRDKRPSKALSWDEMFDDDDQDEDNCGDSKQVCQMDGEINAGDCIVEENCGDDVNDEEVREWTDGNPQMDNSMDLFGDDEAFLQMTIPDIPTPRVSPRTSPTTRTAQKPRSGEDAETNSTADALQAIAKAQKAQSTTDNAGTSDLHVQQTSFDKSHDLFSVHFDLGYSLDDSDEDREDDPDLWASAFALPPKQADSSTPCSCTHKKPLQSKEPKLSTPLMPSEHRRTSVSPFFPSPPKGNAFPSPITTTRARRIILPGPSSPRTPCVLSSLKRRRQGDLVDQESVSPVPLSPHPGRFHSLRNFRILHDLFCDGS